MFRPLKQQAIRVSPILMVVALLGTMTLVGCGEKDSDTTASNERPAPRPRPRPEPADDFDDDDRGSVGTAYTTAGDVLFEMRLDRKIGVVDPQAGVNDRNALEAALRFAELFAEGNAEELRQMLSEGDRQTLDQLVASGAWQADTGMIQKVSVEESGRSGTFRYILTMDAGYTSIEWRADARGDGYTFSAAKSDRLSYDDQDPLASSTSSGAGAGMSFRPAEDDADNIDELAEEETDEEEEVVDEDENSSNPAHRIKRHLPGGGG
jgi:hypothetical protein